MKRSVVLLAGVLVILAGLAATAADDKPWFDMEKCAFCKNVTAHEGLMEHMDYEYHMIDNGALGVGTVDPEYKEAYHEVQMAMQKTAEQMQETGRIPYMCDHCSTYGALMMSGARMELKHGRLADITLMTSEDPEMVKKIQAFAKRTNEEMVKWKAERASE